MMLCAIRCAILLALAACARSLHHTAGRIAETRVRYTGTKRAAASAAPNNGTSVLCRSGKWLPELFLLGGPKCGTSAMAMQLIQNGIPSAVDKTGFTNIPQELADDDVDSDSFLAEKEMQFFTGWLRRSKGRWNATLAMQDWTAVMPECPSLDSQRSLFADYTPGNLALVPPAASLNIDREVLAYGYNLTSINLPATLELFYGEFSPRLSFVVMLREPLSQLQSLWYHALFVWLQTQLPPIELLGDLADLPPQRNATFTSQLEEALDLVDRGTMPLWLWYAFFGRQLEAYLDHFAAEHFVFIPMYHFLSDGPGRDEVCSTLQQRLDFHVACAEAATAVSSHEHPSLIEDVPVTSELRARFDTFMLPEIELLVQVLFHAYLEGAHLPAFHPQNTSAPMAFEVEDWLRAGW
mmetsp:Transcript_61290/g.113784  ORF Transcript_61290/g.113784 Transcript_61290/m.113784 type:complete len:409 (+) Transcript_61290:82-1308(+)